eukprot:scaffold253990_cov31-Tisochrysis_lutea.AAC.6
MATLGDLYIIPLSAERVNSLEWWAAAIDALYSLVAMVTSAVHLARKQSALLTTTLHEKPGMQRKITLQRLSLLKYCCDFLKDCNSIGLRGLNGTGVPLKLSVSAGLTSGLISTHNWLVKLQRQHDGAKSS